MDAVSDIFRTLQITALVQSKLEATAPWAVRLDVQPAHLGSEDAFAHRPGVAYFGMISRGNCWLKMSGRDEPIALEQGDCFLLAPQVSFSLSDDFRATPVSFCSLRTKVTENVVHHGGGGRPTSIIWGLLQFNQASVRPITALLPRWIVICGDQGKKSGLHATLEMLASEMSLQVPGSDVAADRLAEVLFVQTLRAHIALDSEHGKGGWLSAIFDPQIGKAMKAIHADIRAPWTVDSIAAAAGMSRSAFAARFKDLLGESPMQYVTGWRMQKSLELLTRSDGKLSDVGMQVGYETDAAFSKAFKRVVGVTPGQYRSTHLSSTERQRSLAE